MKKHDLHIGVHSIFGMIWLGMCIVFILQAVDCFHQESVKLARYETRIPSSHNVMIGNIRFQDVINGIADSVNKNVGILERSIHDSARLSSKLNLLSAVMSFLGFIGQAGHYIHGRGDNEKASGDQKLSTQPSGALETTRRLIGGAPKPKDTQAS